MDLNEKLDAVLGILKQQSASLASLDSKIEDVSEKQDQLAEAVSDLGKPGSGYSIFDPDAE
jgi:hypothetical protein